MKNELMKNKHYLLIIGALLIANYILVPLSDWQVELKQNTALLDKQKRKVDNLVDNSDYLNEALESSEKSIAALNKVLFVIPTTDKFKLTVQSKIEKALNDAGCSIERIGFNGETEVTQSITRWSMEMRYKGDLGCMTKATRAVESLSPYVQVESYNMNNRGFNKSLGGRFNAKLQVNVWHKENTE